MGQPRPTPGAHSFDGSLMTGDGPEGIGPLIARLRHVARLSQARLAVRVNDVSGATLTRWDISRYEREKRIPDVHLPALATALDVNVRRLEEACEVTRAAKRGVELADRAASGDTANLQFATQLGGNNDEWERIAEMLRRAFMKQGFAVAARPLLGLDRSQRVTQALDIMGHDRIGAVTDSLGELIDHYALTICSLPPTEVYDELLAVRAYASGVLNRASTTAQRTDLILATGWLSGLLGIAACDMGEHAAAQVWCVDAKRQSRDTKHPELEAWATLTRSMIAFYQGQSRHSMVLASQGQRAAPVGTVAHAKLASQEMRAAAMSGDADRMTSARRYAAAAIAKLPSDASVTGAFSINLAEDPPYTATSLMLLGRYREAVDATNRVIQTVYQPEARQRGEHPSGYARSLLILGLAQAGNGNPDEAVAAGQAALRGSRPAWPTIVLAGELDRALERRFAGARQVAEYHAHYLELTGSSGGNCLQLTGPQGSS